MSARAPAPVMVKEYCIRVPHCSSRMLGRIDYLGSVACVCFSISLESKTNEHKFQLYSPFLCISLSFCENRCFVVRLPKNLNIRPHLKPVHCTHTKPIKMSWLSVVVVIVCDERFSWAILLLFQRSFECPCDRLKVKRLCKMIQCHANNRMRSPFEMVSVWRRFFSSFRSFWQLNFRFLTPIILTFIWLLSHVRCASASPNKFVYVYNVAVDE